MSHADPGSGGGRGPAACRDMSLAWPGNPRGRRVGGLPEASWKSWDGARPLSLRLPPGSAMGPGWGGWGPPRSVLPKEQTLPRSPPFKQKENSLGGEARGWEGSWNRNPGLWVEVPGCPGRSRDEGMAPCSCLTELPGRPGPGPPVPVPRGSWPRAWPSSFSEHLLQTPGTWGCGSECHMKGLRRAPGPPVLGPEGLELRRSQGEQQPHLLLRVSTPCPPCRRDNRAPGGAGGCVSQHGKWCRPVQGRVSRGPSQRPPARSVPWATLFKGKLLDLGGPV